LKPEAVANAQRDVEMVAEWFPIEEEGLAHPSRTGQEPQDNAT